MAPAGFGGRVEGVHAVAAALDAGRLIRLTVEAGRGGGTSSDLVERARQRGVDVRTVNSILDHAETDAPQGLVGDASPIDFLSLDDVATGACALLVLDHLEDPRNVGAIARSALAAGMTALVVPERRSAPMTAATMKSAAGALEMLPVARVSSVADCAARLTRAGVWTVGLAAAGDQSLFGLELLTEPVAIFVGAEASGLGRLVGERLDVIASIPMDPLSESLNASVAAALACFEVSRVRRGI